MCFGCELNEILVLSYDIHFRRLRQKNKQKPTVYLLLVDAPRCETEARLITYAFS